VVTWFGGLELSILVNKIWTKIEFDFVKSVLELEPILFVFVELYSLFHLCMELGLEPRFLEKEEEEKNWFKKTRTKVVE
jgi:hypothetical protein